MFSLTLLVETTCGNALMAIPGWPQSRGCLFILRPDFTDVSRVSGMEARVNDLLLKYIHILLLIFRKKNIHRNLLQTLLDHVEQSTWAQRGGMGSIYDF